MDPYTTGMILRALLASAGLKATILIVLVGGFIFGIFKAVRAAGGFLQQLLISRDTMLSDTMRRIAQQDLERAQFQVQVMTIMERINGHQEATLAEVKDSRKEMYQRFNQISLEHTEMKSDLAFIKGAKTT